MGRYIFNLPDIGEGIAEAEIVVWHVALGDTVEEDAPLADMMTDKATVEMESPVSGKVIEIAGEAGDMVAIGSPLVVLEVEGAATKADAPLAETESVEPEPEAVSEQKLPTRPISAQTAHASSGEAERPTNSGEKILASPAVRKRASELGVDLAEVSPAADGRVRHADLDAFVTYNAAGGFQPAGRKGRDEQVKVIGLRRRIAESMAESKRNIPHFSYVEEYDVTELEKARTQLNDGRGERSKLTILPFLMAAVCRLVPEFPMLNAHFDDDAGVVTRFGAVNMGIAVQTPAGLMVPVIHDAQDRNLWQLAAEVVRLADAARDGSASAYDLSGSTMTITSLGPLGGIASTPVIHRPEVVIIAPNKIVERPMFVADGMGGERVEKRKLMNVSFSCDHRVVDGWDAARFAQELKKLIESPALLLAG